MKNEGFTLKTGKWIWKHDEEELLKQTLIGISNGSITVTTQDPHHFISHHIFHGKISKKDVKAKAMEWFPED